MEDFEIYLAKRKRRGKVLLIAAPLLLAAGFAVPYALNEAGIISSSAMAVIMLFDSLLCMGIVRAGVIRLMDKAKWPEPFT
jgi:hypothetical protein